MDSKRVGKRLAKLGYRLDRDIFGWIVVSEKTGFEYRFSTIGGVSRFATDQEAMTDYVYRNGF